MRVVLGHRIALVPTAAQEVRLRQAVGVSRFAYNWALAEWKRQYQAGEKPSKGALRRQRLRRGRLWRWSDHQRETSLAEAGISHVLFGHGLSSGWKICMGGGAFLPGRSWVVR